MAAAEAHLFQEQEGVQSEGTPAKLLVVGTQGSGKKTLVRGMLAYEDLIAGRPVAVEVAKAQQVAWQVKTKYYSAALGVTVLDAEPVPQPQEVEEEGGAEGLMLVFDASSEASFEQIRQWVASTADALSEKCELKLCVGNKADLLLEQGQGVRERLYAERIEWCLDHGFEYVETDATRPTLGHEERDKDGVPRVMEAIHATRWSSLTLRSRGAGEVEPSSRGEAGQQQQQQQQPPVLKSSSPPSGEELSSSERGRVAQQAPAGAPVEAAPASSSARPAAGAAHTPANGSSSSSKVDKKESGALNSAVDDLLAGFGDGGDELDVLFDRIREVRQTAGQFSDEERRRRAAEAAVRLAAVLGLGEDED